MANRYWVGGTANWDATAGTKWSTTSGGAGGSAVPTAADDVYIDANAGGNVTIPTATNVTCRSLNFVDGTGGAYTGTFTHASTSANIQIGDGTAGASNVALKLSSGMTYTLTGIGTITLQSTNSTTQTITSNGKTLPNITVNGSGSNYQFADACTSTGNLIYTAGASIDFNSYNHSFSSFSISGNSNTRTVTFGTSVISCTLFGSIPFTAASATNVTISASVGAAINATNSNNTTINLGSLNYGNVAVSHTTTSAQTSVLTSSGATIYSYTRTGAASKTDMVRFTAGGSLTVSNSLALNGNSEINRLTVNTGTPGTSFTITNNGSNSMSYVALMDISGAGSASWDLSAITGYSGDCGGNSGITFTTPATQTFGAGAGNASNVGKWTSRIPLPQDDVVVNASSGNITLDMVHVGKNIDFTGFTGTCSWATGLGQTIYGSLTLVSAMTLSFGNTVNWVLAGRGSHTFDSAGKTFTGTNMSTTVNAFGGTYTLASAFTTGHSFNVLAGTFNSNGYTVTSSAFSTSGSIVRGVTLGATTWNLTTTTGTPWSLTSSNLTFSAGTSTIAYTTTSASTRTFGGGSVTYYNFSHTVAGSTGQITISGSNTFNSISFSDVTNARTLAIIAGTTQTLTSESINGTSGKLMSIVSTVGGTPAYINYIGTPQSHDYVSVQDIYSVIPRKMFCTNSTNVSGNLNVTFSAATSEPYILWQASATGSGTTTNITLPYATTSGDLIVVGYGNSSNGTGTITPPTGFVLDKGASAATAMRIYSKVADGTETTLTWTSTLSPAATVLLVLIIRDTGYTASVDVTDGNSGSSITALSTGAGATNTTTRAFAVGMYMGSGSLGASVSATNSWEWVRPSTEVSFGRTIVKPLSSTASQTSTYTWTTSRNADAEMVVYKFATSANRFLSLLGVGS